MSLGDHTILASIKEEFLSFLEGVPDAMVCRTTKAELFW
jgi:hypothetical protein